MLLVSVLFSRTPYHPYILASSIGGWGGSKIASASTPSANEPAKDVILVHTVQLKSMIKAKISGRMISSGINDVAFASVYSEKICLKKCMMIIIIIIMKKSQETTDFRGCQKLTFAMKLKGGRLIQGSLHREPP